MAQGSRFHFNPATGRVGACKAEQNCPFISANDHFDSAEDARSGYEAYMDSNTDSLKSVQAEVGEKRNRKTASNAVASGGWEGSGFAMNPYTATPGRLYVDLSGHLWQATSIDASDVATGPKVHLTQVSNDGKLTEATQVVRFGASTYTQHSPDKFEEFDLSPEEKQALTEGKTYEEILADSYELRQLEEEYQKWKNVPRNYGFPEDEMQRTYADNNMQAAKVKLDALAGRMGYRPTSQRALDAIAMQRPKGQRVEAKPLAEGKYKLNDVVIGRVQYNKVRPGETPRASEAGTKIVLVPDVQKLTKGRKLRIAKELWSQAGRPAEDWDKVAPSLQEKLANQWITRQNSIEVEVDDKTVSWQGRYNSSNGNDAADVSRMTL